MMRFRIECRNEDCGVGAGNIRTQSAFGFVSISCNSHETSCPNQSFINFKRTLSYFSLPVFFPWFLSEEKEIGGKSFPDPTSAVRLAVSSQKVDVACEKYPAPILPLCITNHTFLSGTGNVEGYFYFQSSFTQKLDDFLLSVK